MRRRKGPFSIWLVAVLFAMGVGACVWGWMEYQEVKAFMRTAVRVQGEVVRYEELAEGHVLIIGFQVEGMPVEIAGSAYGPQYREGQRVVVAYPPGQPNLGRFADVSDLYRTASIYGSLGGVTVAVSLVLLLIWWRRRADNRPAFAR